MTGRRRSGGSHHGSTGSHTPTRRPGGDGSDGGTTRRPGGSGGGVGTDLDAIDTMAGRLDATRGRVEGVGDTVRGVNVGPQSMGVIGSGFAGAAQAHLRTAEQHVARTTQAVEQAHRGTRGTAQAYRDTDATNAAARNGIDTTTRPPHPAGSGTTTTPAAAAGATMPSIAPTTGGAAPAAAHSGGGTPPPVGPPPGGPGGGGPGGPGGPSGPSGPGGTGGSPTSPGRPPSTGSSGEHWMRTVQNNFSDKDFADFQRAVDKMAADPKPGEVPGSGQLTRREKDLVARAMGLVRIEPGTLMQKVIPPNSVQGYLGDLRPDGTYAGGPYRDVRGFVARHQDAGALARPDDIIDGNRLDYANTPYRHGQDHIHTMEFPAGDNVTNYQTPVGAPKIPGEISGHNPAVVRATDDMLDAAERAGVNPDTYQRSTNAWPYSGIGVTAHPTMGVPEFEIGTPVDIPRGATINEYDAAGRKTVIAVFDGKKWVQP